MTGLSSVISTAAAGLSAAASRTASIAQSIASPNGLDTLPRSVVDLDLAKRSFQANALVLKTADKMLGTLLDVLDTTGRRPR